MTIIALFKVLRTFTGPNFPQLYSHVNLVDGTSGRNPTFLHSHECKRPVGPTVSHCFPLRLSGQPRWLQKSSVALMYPRLPPKSFPISLLCIEKDKGHWVKINSLMQHIQTAWRHQTVVWKPAVCWFFFYLFFFFAPTRRVSLPWLTLVQPSKPFDAMYSLFMAVGFISVWVLFGSEFFFGFALVSYFLFFPFLSVPCFLRLLVCYWFDFCQCWAAACRSVRPLTGVSFSFSHSQEGS